MQILSVVPGQHLSGAQVSVCYFVLLFLSNLSTDFIFCSSNLIPVQYVPSSDQEVGILRKSHAIVCSRVPDDSHSKSGVIQQRQNCLEAQQAEGQEAPVLKLAPCISTRTANQVRQKHLGVKGNGVSVNPVTQMIHICQLYGEN